MKLPISLYPTLRLISVTTFIVLLLHSCKNDFDVNGEWKDVPVIYGLLSPVDSVQYIKVNRAFLGKGNAYDMAKSPDSINYKKGEIVVKLERKSSSGSLQETILLDYDSSIAKESGTFASSPNILYRTNHRILQDGSTYALSVTNNVTGNVATAQTPVVGKISITAPNQLSKMDWTYNYSKAKQPFRVRWQAAKNGKVYQLVIRFHYKDVSKIVPGDTVERYADWGFPTVTSDNDQLEQEIYGEDFYKFVKSAVPVDNNLKRIAVGMEFMFSIGADEFYNYNLINRISNGLVQEKPSYSNITNGTGIFSSRDVQKTVLLLFSPNSILAFDTTSYTSNLGFCDPNNTASPFYCD